MKPIQRLREGISDTVYTLCTSPNAFKAEIGGGILACAGVRIIGEDHPLAGLALATVGLGLGASAMVNNDFYNLQQANEPAPSATDNSLSQGIAQS